MDTSPVLDAASLDGRSFENILKDIQEVFDDTTFPTVRRWREHGGKVVGHFQVYFPEEIAEPARLLLSQVRRPAWRRRGRLPRRGAAAHLCEQHCGLPDYSRSIFQLAGPPREDAARTRP